MEDFANTKAASKEFMRGSANCLAPAQVKKNTAQRIVNQGQADGVDVGLASFGKRDLMLLRACFGKTVNLIVQ